MLISVRLQNDVSMANLNVAKKSEKQKHEVQFLCISSISPQFHHYFLLQHKHIIAIMPLDKWCHIIHSHCHDFLHRMVYSFLHILQFFRSQKVTLQSSYIAHMISAVKLPETAQKLALNSCQKSALKGPQTNKKSSCHRLPENAIFCQNKLPILGCLKSAVYVIKPA